MEGIHTEFQHIKDYNLDFKSQMLVQVPRRKDVVRLNDSYYEVKLVTWDLSKTRPSAIVHLDHTGQ